MKSRASDLAATAAASGLTLKTIIFGAWGLLLARYYRSSSVTFGTIRSCCPGSIEGADEMIGPLVNYLPVHADLSGDPPLLAFLRGLQEQQLAIGDHRWTTPDLIRSSLPAAASKQLFDSCVICQPNTPEREMAARFGGNGQRRFSIRERPNLPLLLAASEQPGLAFELVYQPDLFERPEIEQLVRSFLALLRQFPSKLNAPVSELELLSPEKTGRRWLTR